MDRVSVMKRKNFPVSSNCYIIGLKGEPECILVDPALGDDAEFAAFLGSYNLKPQYIVLTHEHFDHISSVEYLRGKFGSIVIATRICSACISDAKKNLSLYYNQAGFVCSPAEIIVDEDNDRIIWKDQIIQFYMTPGHSEGGLCFKIRNNLFSGDTLMQDFKPVFKLPGGNKSILENSIKRLMDILSDDMVVYPGHGEAFTRQAINW
ncbi:MAG: MBL fold metallo-hydrolase [Ferruginibacter sp.]